MLEVGDLEGMVEGIRELSDGLDRVVTASRTYPMSNR